MRRDVFLAEDFRAEDFRAEDFRAEDFRAEDFRAEDFRAEDFRAGERFFALDLRPPDFRALDLRPLDFRALDFRPAERELLFFPRELPRVDFFAAMPVLRVGGFGGWISKIRAQWHAAGAAAASGGI